MKIIYVTDLHGVKWKFDRLLDLAKEFRVEAVVNGGDILPKECGFLEQEEFISFYLDEYFEKFNELKINYLYYPGNDDPMIFDRLLENISEKYPFIINMAQRKFNMKGFEFVGMNWVVDYPFPIKDRCRMDTDDYVFQEQYGKGRLSEPNHWKEIDDWFSFAKTLPTIENEMDQLIKPKDFSKSVYILHMPPANLGLDHCSIDIKIGSKAIYNFIKKKQPRFSLHGHIHESPEMSGLWKSMVGETICIQPGQNEDLSFVTIDLETKKSERIIESREKSKNIIVNQNGSRT